MKLKFFSFIMFLLILSGCTLEYELIIDENLIITEYVKVQETNDIISTYSNNIDGFLDSFLFEYERSDDFNYYFFEKIKKDNSSGIIASYTYLDFNEFKEKNKIYSDFFSNINISTNDNIIKIYFEGKETNVLLRETDLNTSPLSGASIIINLPFKVINNNADLVEKNKYIWNFNSNNYNKNIILEFDSSKKNFKMPPISYLIVILIIVSLIFLISRLYNKYRENSKF